MRFESTSTSNESRLRDFWPIVRRRWVLILVTMVAIVGAATIYTFQMDPVYRSIISLEVEGRNQAQPNSVYSPLDEVTIPNPDDDILTQTEVIQSYDILVSAMQSIGKVPPPPSPDIIQDPLVTVQQVGLTNVLQVSVQSRDSSLASDLATAIPNVYSQYVQSRLSQKVVDAANYAQTQATQAQNLIVSLQKKLEAFRKKYQISDVNAETDARLRRLEDAQANSRQADARLASAQKSYAEVVTAYAALPKTVNDQGTQNSQQFIQEQRSKLADLQGQYQTARVIYLDSSQQVQKLKAQVDAQQKYLDAIPKSINQARKVRNPNLDTFLLRLSDAKSELAGAQAADAKTTAQLAQAQAELDVLTSHKGEFERLNAQMIQAQDNSASIQKTLTDLKIRESAANRAVHALSQASPSQIVKPKPVLYLGAAFVFACIVAWALVTVREKLDDRVHSIDSAREIAGIRAMGAVPLPAGNRGTGLVIASAAPQAESFRLLRSNVLFTVGGEAMRSIAIVSGRNNEGRTEIAANLAASMALGSHQVVLIDANLRRPLVHTTMNLSEGPGLTDILLGYKTLKEVMQPTSVEGLTVITAGSQSQSSTELLSSEAFSALLDQLKEEYHFIIVDAAAGLASADAQVTADSCDAALMVIKIGATRKATIRYVADMIKRTRTNLLGVIYNRSEKAGRGGPIEYSEYEDEVA